MDDLIAKLEAATEGSRELSDEIALAKGWTFAGGAYNDTRLWTAPDGHYVGISRPDFSRSLDAALQLVPDGWTFFIDGPDRGLGGPIHPEAGVHKIGGDPNLDHNAFGATPALALCIAALKARALVEKSNG